MNLNRLFAAVFVACASFAGFAVGGASAQNGPLKIDITEGVIEPLPYAAPAFVAENPEAARFAEEIANVVRADLTGTRLLREIPQEAHISGISSFDAPIRFSDWKAINAAILITGSARLGEDGTLEVKFRLFDVFAEKPLGAGSRFSGGVAHWRRMAHKTADAVYASVTGETGYFDTRVAFISESGPKDARVKRLAIMDYDGANVHYLTEGNEIVLAPRFSPDGKDLILTSYETGVPRVQLMSIETGARRPLAQFRPDEMAFAPRFSPDGRRVIYSLTRNGNTDIFEADLGTGAARKLSNSAAIDTAPSYSPDGKWIVFESDRSGGPQLYIRRLPSGEATRISRGRGQYGTPVWSPRGDFVAFTKQLSGRFHIGVMRVDGSEERLLTESFLDEGPTWAPNGRVLMFFRETPGARGGPMLYSVDLTGRNLRRQDTPRLASDGDGRLFASDPAWGPLRE